MIINKNQIIQNKFNKNKKLKIIKVLKFLLMKQILIRCIVAIVLEKVCNIKAIKTNKKIENQLNINLFLMKKRNFKIKKQKIMMKKFNKNNKINHQKNKNPNLKRKIKVQIIKKIINHFNKLQLNKKIINKIKTIKNLKNYKINFIR